MKIPVVTDEMLGPVIAAAASPVFVLWEDSSSLDFRGNRVAVEFVSDEFDTKIIFVRISIDENPECAASFRMRSPGYTIFKKTVLVARSYDRAPIHQIRQDIEDALTKAA